MYAIVISGFKGPERKRDKRVYVFVKKFTPQFLRYNICIALCELLSLCFVCVLNYMQFSLKVL